jgi:hypothetical protein
MFKNLDYLGMDLDTQLWWKEHIKKKRNELNIKFRKMYWLLRCNSELSVHSQIILYKQVIHPVWSYSIQLCGCASVFNIEVIQHYQNKVLKCIVNAPLCGRNSDLHYDLRIKTVTVITVFTNSHEKRLFKTISTLKHPDFLTWTISQDNSNGRNHLN